MRCLIVACAAALAGCAAAQPHRTNATLPTVSYAFDSEAEFRQAAALADEYCAENYGRNARLAQPVYGAGEATFVCVE